MPANWGWRGSGSPPQPPCSLGGLKEPSPAPPFLLCLLGSELHFASLSHHPSGSGPGRSLLSISQERRPLVVASHLAPFAPIRQRAVSPRQEGPGAAWTLATGMGRNQPRGVRRREEEESRASPGPCGSQRPRELSRRRDAGPWPDPHPILPAPLSHSPAPGGLNLIPSLEMPHLCAALYRL